jgi:soluble P-type ATPase
MLDIEIPGFGPVRLAHLVSDFTGTLSVEGELLPGVGERLLRVAALLTVHILTADTFGKVWEALQGIDCRITILTGEAHDVQKEGVVRNLGPEQVVAFGNGNNDHRMLRLAKLGIAVSEAEGCSVKALVNADIHVCRSVDGLDLLLHPKRCRATLRY